MPQAATPTGGSVLDGHNLAFRSAMEAKGLFFKGELNADGQLHRIHIEGDGNGSRNGWYVMHADGRPAGKFGCWKKYQNLPFKWLADRGSVQMSPEERRALRDKINADKAQRAAEEKEKQDAAAARAMAVWEKATPAPDDHPYLKKKGVASRWVRVGTWEVESLPDRETGEIHTATVKNALLVPIKRGKDLVSLQAIFPSDKNALKRGKDYLWGGAKKGCFYVIGDKASFIDERRVFVFVEGYSTGASILAATGHQVVICFDVGNLGPVSAFFRANYPAALMIIAADNDAWTEKPVKNPGVYHGRKAAIAAGALLAIPKFKSSTLKPTDFNDLAAQEGDAEVALQIAGAVDPTTVVLSPPPPAAELVEPVDPELLAALDAAADVLDPNVPDDPKYAERQATLLLGIPSVYQVTDRAVERAKDNHEYEFVCSRLDVLARTRDENSANWGSYLRLVDADGVEKSFAVPQALVANDGRELVEQLVNLGLTLGTAPKASQYLRDYIQGCMPTARMRCVTRVGWNGKSFTLPGAALDASAADPVILQSPIASAHAYRQSGSLDDWKAQVARYAVGNSRLAFSISIAFAAPMLDLTGDESGGVHWCGGSSIGKSTALVVAGSVWGGGAGRGYLKSWKATDNGLEAVAAAHCDTLLCLDEMGEVASNVAGSAAYSLANGSGKQRADRNGESKKAATWRTLFLSSGEISLSAKMDEDGRGRRPAAGQEVRILNLEADASKNLGIFEVLHDFASGDEFSTQLKSSAGKYYGTAAPAFIKNLIGDRAGTIDRVSVSRENWTARNVPSASDGQVLRAARRFSLVAAAGEEAIAQNILPWPAGQAHWAAEICFKGWMAERGGTGDAESKSGLAQVRAFFEAHGASRFTEVTTGVQADAAADGLIGMEKTINRAGWRRRISGGKWEYYVLPETWTSEICRGLNIRSANKMFVKLGILRPDVKGSASQTIRIPGYEKPRVYVVTASIIDHEED